MESQNFRQPDLRVGRCGASTGNVVSFAGSTEGCGRELEQSKLLSGGWQPRLCDDCTKAQRDEYQRVQNSIAAREIESKIARSGVPPLVIHSLKTISPVGKSLEIRRTVDRLLANDLPQRWAVMTGPKGSGKTTEAARACVEAIRNGGSAAFVGFSELLLEIRQTYGSERGSELGILNRFRGAGLLVLDDVGTSRPSSHTSDVLYAVVNYRYERGLRTIITSNYPIGKLGAYLAPAEDRITADRIMDRIVELSLWIDFSGIDSYRLAAAQRSDRDWSWADGKACAEADDDALTVREYKPRQTEGQ